MKKTKKTIKNCFLWKKHFSFSHKKHGLKKTCFFASLHMTPPTLLLDKCATCVLGFILTYPTYNTEIWVPVWKIEPETCHRGIVLRRALGVWLYQTLAVILGLFKGRARASEANLSPLEVIESLPKGSLGAWNGHWCKSIRYSYFANVVTFWQVYLRPFEAPWCSIIWNINFVPFVFLLTKISSW